MEFSFVIPFPYSTLCCLVPLLLVFLFFWLKHRRDKKHTVSLQGNMVGGKNDLGMEGNSSVYENRDHS